MQALLFRCRCGAGLVNFTADHASHVWKGEIFCSHKCVCAAQTVAKCQELGITHYSTTRLPIHSGAP